MGQEAADDEFVPASTVAGTLEPQSQVLVRCSSPTTPMTGSNETNSFAPRPYPPGLRYWGAEGRFGAAMGTRNAAAARVGVERPTSIVPDHGEGRYNTWFSKADRKVARTARYAQVVPIWIKSRENVRRRGRPLYLPAAAL